MRINYCWIVLGSGLLSLAATEGYGQAPTRATYLGATFGAGFAFTPMSPQRVELPPVSYLAAQPGGYGDSFAFSVFVTLVRNHWFLQPKLLYQGLNSCEVTYYGGPGSFFGGTRTGYFSARQLGISAALGRTFGSRRQFYYSAGPAWVWRTDGPTGPPPSATTSLGDDIRYALETAPARQQVQVLGELGWWARHWGISARINQDLTPLVRRVDFDGRAYPFRVTSTTAMFSFGYRLSMERKPASITQ